MSDQHIVLISRRFSPAIGGAEGVMANLAFEFASLGLRTTVLTSQFDRRLPSEELQDGYRIIRIPTSTARFVGTSRYMFGLRRWLRNHSESIDGVIVSMLKHCASVAVRTLVDSNVPVIVRGEGTGATGDCAWHSKGRFGMHIRETCKKADALIAFTPALANELIAAGYSSNQIHQVANGVRTSHCTEASERDHSRMVLSRSMPEFSASPTDLVSVYTGRLHEGKGLLDLIRSWPLVLNEHPTAKCWLVGDGPQYELLRHEIKALGLDNAVRLAEPNIARRPIDLLLRASDIFVLPSYEEGMSLSLLEALACGTPCCVSDIVGNRALIQPGQNGLVFPIRDARQLAATASRLLRDKILRNRLGEAGFRLVEERFSAARMAAEHWKIIEAARSQKKSRRG